jgi:organic hydroperoxide reductase OsmC/OhrA
MIELIWDADCLGTITLPGGTPIAAGDHGGSSPNDLLAGAAAGCLMRTFLGLAAERHLAVLSYAATAGVEDGGGSRRARVHVRSFITASEGANRRQIIRVCEQAVRASPIARLLGDRVRAEFDVRVLHGGCVVH